MSSDSKDNKEAEGVKPQSDGSSSDTCVPLSKFPDRSFFHEAQVYPALAVPVQQTATLRKTLKDLLFQRPRTQSIYPSPSDPRQRIMVLRNDRLDLFEDEIIVDLIQNHGCSRTTHTIEMNYEDYNVEQALRKILPTDNIENVEIPSAFEQVGSIAHLNLRGIWQDYKRWIGKVLLDKNQPQIKTVVTKVGTIETEYRTFGMEVIAGDAEPGWSEVTVKEEGCSFQLDFQQVYWNSRLAGEHKRLVSEIRREARQSKREMTVVADLMAGVGPFAVPLTATQPRGGRQKDGTQPKIRVYANDLNPASFKYLEINAANNQCRLLHTFNQDARAFVQYLEQEKIEPHHVIMNLPASAPEFLDAFRGYYSDLSTALTPRVHVHCFCAKAGAANNYQEAVDRCADSLGCPLDRKTHAVQVHVVRDVSPQKFMLCVSFDLPDAVRRLPSKPTIAAGQSDAAEPDSKRAKTN